MSALDLTRVQLVCFFRARGRRSCGSVLSIAPTAVSSSFVKTLLTVGLNVSHIAAEEE